MIYSVLFDIAVYFFFITDIKLFIFHFIIYVEQLFLSGWQVPTCEISVKDNKVKYLIHPEHMN